MYLFIKVQQFDQNPTKIIHFPSPCFTLNNFPCECFIKLWRVEQFDCSILQRDIPSNIMSDHSQTMVKVLYLDEQTQWQQYCQASLRLQTRIEQGINLLLTPTAPLPAQKLTILPLVQIQRERDRTICIGVEMISQVQRLHQQIIAIKLEQWNRVLGLSFRTEQYCSVVLEQIQLEIATGNQLPCLPEELIKYIAKEINSVDLAFENAVIAQQFFNRIAQGKLDTQEENDAFRIVKTVFMQGRKQTISVLMKQQHFPSVLKALSYNFQFGDRRIDYLSQFQRICRCRNILEFQQEQIINHYRDIMKARFLIDYPTAMFIQPNTQYVLNEIIRENTIPILKILIEQPDFLKKYKELALIDPVIFIELFSQLWEMFKLVSEDWNTNELKNKFHTHFLKQNLMEITFECVLKVANQNKAELRLYQKFLQSLNPFLSFKWNQSQQFLLSFYKSNQVHLARILVAIMVLNDYNTKTVVLLFARYLIQTSDNRKAMRQAFLSYVFSEFVAKIDPFFTSPQDLEIYLSFLMRCYNVDDHRTRRCISEGSIIAKLQEKCQNKYVLILIVRFLRNLLELRHKELFIYLERHKSFSFLRQAYFRAKKYSPRGILYSMFLGLIKDLERSDNKCGVKYVFDIMCPQEKQ